jgi:hypothetical protein
VKLGFAEGIEGKYRLDNFSKDENTEFCDLINFIFVKFLS